MQKNRLNNLLAQNRGAPREYKIEAKADGSEATIYLYDVIGYDWWTDGGVTALKFAADLNAIRGVSTLHIRFNTPGGDVFEGRAMCAALDAHPAKKIGYVDGYAASAGSFILMHCDEIEITQGAMIMIHNGWTVAAGDNRTMLETGSLLKKIDGAIQDDYMRRVSADREQIDAWMNAETWFTAQEAIEHGFADRVSAGGDGKKNRAAWNMAAYTNAPTTEQPPAEQEPSPAPDVPEEPARDYAAEHAERKRRIPPDKV